MLISDFFDKYPDAWIVTYRTKAAEWYAALYDRRCYQKEKPPVLEVAGNSAHVALDNLATKLLRWEPPEEKP